MQIYGTYTKVRMGEIGKDLFKAFVQIDNSHK